MRVPADDTKKSAVQLNAREWEPVQAHGRPRHLGVVAVGCGGGFVGVGA